MADVGKTTALIGRGHDAEVKAHFVHGILFMSLGAAATEESVANELSKILELTGAESRASEVAAASSLSEAVSRTAIWFYGKRVLLLIHDIWLAPSRPQGFLPESGGLLQGSPESRIAISTRSTAIAINTGSNVDFDTRDPQGSVAVGIFMSHAMPDKEFDDDSVESAVAILEHCAGLPIALAVTGEAVAIRLNAGLRLGIACEKYFELLSYKMHAEVSALDAAINLSLKSLQDCADEESFSTACNLREKYLSLCVLDNQEQALVSVLGRMWKVEESAALDICASRRCHWLR